MSEETKGLRLYNTLTRTKEAFAPIDPENVRMYVCGPTVYDFAHIGNARPVIVFDVLFRLLRHLYGDDHVTYVRNITDVDDKINARALRDYGAEIAAGRLDLNQAIRKVTEPTYRQYQLDVAALCCLPPTDQPRATEYVLPRGDGKANMKDMIQTLIDRGHAYVASGREGYEVLFDVGSMPDYGALSKRKLDEQQAGARVAVEDHKKNPEDFVLWKESGRKEPGWNGEFVRNPRGGYDAEFDLSPENANALGRNTRTVTIHGRPGWHIECSVMSDALLWDGVRERLSSQGREHPHQFDIHGGGLDLIFPHHENEIAQSRCAHGTDRMANIWMHNGFVQVEGRKMSKSEGNFFTINELLKEWAGPVMRLVMLQTHYRQPIDWTVSRLLAARQELADWASQVFDGELLGRFEANLIAGNRGEIDSRVLSPLLDDLNSVDALTGMRTLYSEARERDEANYSLLNAAHFLGLIPLRKIGALLSNSTFGSAPIQRFAEFRDLYRGVQAASANSAPQTISAANDQVAPLGIIFTVGENDGFVSLDKKAGDGQQSDNVLEKIEQRLAFIAAKNWPEADRVRDELLAQGIQLKDGKDPATGERITTWEVKR